MAQATEQAGGCRNDFVMRGAFALSPIARKMVPGTARYSKLVKHLSGGWWGGGVGVVLAGTAQDWLVAGRRRQADGLIVAGICPKRALGAFGAFGASMHRRGVGRAPAKNWANPWPAGGHLGEEVPAKEPRGPSRRLAEFVGPKVGTRNSGHGQAPLAAFGQALGGGGGRAEPLRHLQHLGEIRPQFLPSFLHRQLRGIEGAAVHLGGQFDRAGHQHLGRDHGVQVATGLA